MCTIAKNITFYLLRILRSGFAHPFHRIVQSIHSKQNLVCLQWHHIHITFKDNKLRSYWSRKKNRDAQYLDSLLERMHHIQTVQAEGNRKSNLDGNSVSFAWRKFEGKNGNWLQRRKGIAEGRQKFWKPVAIFKVKGSHFCTIPYWVKNGYWDYYKVAVCYPMSAFSRVHLLYSFLPSAHSSIRICAHVPQVSSINSL